MSAARDSMLTRLSTVLTLLHRRLLLSSPKAFSRARRLSGMGEPAVVRCLPGEPTLTISFWLDGSHRHMLRDQDEEVGKVLARIKINATKGQVRKAKKSRKRKGPEPSEAPAAPVVRLYYYGVSVADTARNSEAWRDGALLQVGNFKYAVQRNVPTLTTVELPVSLLATYPVCPNLQVEFGKLEDCEFTWYKETAPNASPGDADVSGQDSIWTVVGRERVYVPSNQDIGCRLKLLCTPRDGGRFGPAREAISEGAVEAGPGTCTFDNRHTYTVREVAWPALRVVSYNILADIYAQTELSKNVLYPYCAPYALELDYRQNLIKKELGGYNADIICLQEVDKSVFKDSLSPAMDAFGLDGVFRVKEKQHEGLATFYRRSKFELLSRHDIVLSEALTCDPIHSGLLERVCASGALKQRVQQRSTTLQVSVLKALNETGRTVCVANTHLYWHPEGGNVRLVQMGVALQHLSRVMEDAAPGAPLLFCGDFNSSPDSGVFQLVTEARVPQQHADWGSSVPGDSCSMELLSALPPLQSACSQLAYTNYVGRFHGCLDYIFIQPGNMQVEQVIPPPSHQEVTAYEALPSVGHPSDHIALVCDLCWNP
ncbi:2',5'-phosphodiesterase 12 [Brachionichthys hirsutus]|uniref:2',5'-phosphodiesterase 12 n=1 Tax=Brachionichthys hirsutus TaxID=412623 RepID=UPI0036049B58